MKRQILSITRKELNNYFGSPLAIIFLGTFLAAVLFIFFTIETFFARGIADVRPLFRWMPVLLIFLLAALTMRQWSEEQRSGTQELLLTLPVPPVYLVLGKFLAVMVIIALALALTLPLPITVGLIGNLDWGPVIGGYLAALLMAGAYAAIGLFVSSRTDNQIVALIATVLLGGLFYLVGSSGVTDFFGGRVSDMLWAIGTGSRFESIQRGVIDLRDLIYYLSLTAFFLMLNTVSLDMVRWSSKQQSYRRKVLGTAVLLGLNFILLNVWLFPLQGLRLDLTAQKEYSLSDTTEDLFDSLAEPLLMRAYISEKSHPLLQPLVPQIRDMMREYQIASDGRITAEVVDPLQDPEIEAEANQAYGIRPTPFQVADRYESSVINSYFDILVRYGDQTVTLNFQDLIQVEQSPSGVDVSLRNLEYDLTSAVKKVVFGFQSLDAVLAALDEPVQLTFYVTPNTLPETLLTAGETINSVANEIADESNGKFVYEVVNLDDPNSPVNRQYLQDTFGLQPFPVSFFSADAYYAHMILQNGEELQLLYPPVDVTEAEVRTTIESALKRTSSGFLKVVGVWTPPNVSDPNSQFGAPQNLTNYASLQEQLRQDYTVRPVDLLTGQIPSDVDTLLVIGPQNLTDQELFVIDQFLMRGGSVTLAVSNYTVSVDQFSGGLALQPANTANIQDWLAHYGVTMPQSLVMDTQNQPFPVTVVRQVGDVQVQEIQAVNYPFFVDVRPDGMDTDSPILSNLQTVTLNWASPVQLDEAKNEGRETAVLLRSSAESWLSTNTNTQPDFDLYPQNGFPVEGEPQSYPLTVSLQGQFESYFKDKPSPFEAGTEDATAEDAIAQPAAQPIATITESPESSRLVVIGSAAFAEDSILQLSAALTQDRYLNNLQFAQNVVDWSVEDLDLLAIRSRGASARVLQPMTEGGETVWETINYVIALAALLFVYGLWRSRRRSEQPIELLPVAAETGD